ncbi:hypothetical protein EV426DRAFT_705564 [Tirmania nivea]|nr:hypothetical protein EV426DRAFT_705564 [Tirmania nivea]
MPRDNMILKLLDEVMGVYRQILAHCYLAARGSAERHHTRGISILKNLIRNYPESAFLNLFRMYRISFWILVDLITPMWPTEPGAKTPPYPIYQQVAVALYVLGSVGSGGQERSRIALNISKGAVGIYLWRTLTVLSNLLPKYVKWPSVEECARSAEQRSRAGGAQEIFQDCVGFVDRSIIVLRDKP